MCGEPMAPAERMISRSARSSSVRPPRRTRTATQRPFSSTIRSTSASVSTVRLGRLRAGSRNAIAVLQRRRSRIVVWKRPAPSCVAPLKSWSRGTLQTSAVASASRPVTREGLGSDCTSSGPLPPWYGPSPSSLRSDFLKSGRTSS